MRTKVCPKCEQRLLVTEFSQCQSKKDGLQSHCRKCRNEYYQRNRGKISKRAKEYRIKNRDAISERAKEYRCKNRSRLSEYHRNYYATIKGHLKQIFAGMTQRCTSPNCGNFKHYGGRGIENKFKSSSKFVDYVINNLRVDPRGLEIDRIDNNGHYEKGNIRFVTHTENLNNRKR